MMNPTEILISLTLAISGWSLVQLIGLKSDVAVLQTQIHELQRIKDE